MHLFTRKSHAGSYLRSFNRQAVRVEAEAQKRNVVPADMDGGVARQFEASGGEQSPAFRAELVNGQGVTSLTATSPLASTNHSRLHERDSAEIAAVPPPQFPSPALRAEKLAYDEGIAASKFEAIPPAGGNPADAPSVMPPALISEATEQAASNPADEKPTGVRGCYQSAGSVASA
jgi:hypothetical protein